MSHFPSICYYDTEGNFKTIKLKKEDIEKKTIIGLIGEDFNNKKNWVFQYKPKGQICGIESTFEEFLDLENVPFFFNPGKLKHY